MPTPISAAQTIRHIAHLGIYESKGKARLWLQGKRLADIGATMGNHFDLSTDPATQRIVIDICETGTRKVSGKDNGRVPVIDAVGEQIGAVFPIGTQVQVVFEPGRITVTVRPRDAAAAERASRLARKLANGEPLDTGALSFGMGVLDAALSEGLKSAGIRTHLRWAVEIEDDALEHAASHNPAWKDDTISVSADMSQVDPSLLPKVDCLIAGLPCVAHSRSGRAKQRSMDATLAHPEGHEAGSLFVDLIRFVVALNPSLVVLENVPTYRNSAGYACLKTVLTKLGYSISDTELNSVDWGCNERRERMVMVASTGMTVDLTNIAPNLTPGPISEIMEDIPSDDPRWRSHMHHVAKQQRDAENGKGFKLQVVDPSDRIVGTLGRGYAKDRCTEPHIRCKEDPAKSRLFTVTEHAALKQVPPTLISGLQHTRGHQLLGQSVAMPPFRSVGFRIAATLLGRKNFARFEPSRATAVQPIRIEATPPAGSAIGCAKKPAQLSLF